MNELVRIHLKDNQIQTVSAREVYEFLELNPSHFHRWTRKYISKNDLSVLGEDYFEFSPLRAKNSSTNALGAGRPQKDYQLTIQFAKKLCMMSKTPKGEQIRNYFLAIEKKLESASKILPNAPTYLIHEQKSEQLDNSKGARSLHFRSGGVSEYKGYSKELVEAVTGKDFAYVKTWLIEHGHTVGISKTDINKGVKHCIRIMRPHLAKTMSFLECYQISTGKPLKEFAHKAKHISESYKMIQEMEGLGV